MLGNIMKKGGYNYLIINTKKSPLKRRLTIFSQSLQVEIILHANKTRHAQPPRYTMVRPRCKPPTQSMSASPGHHHYNVHMSGFDINELWMSEGEVELMSGEMV